MSDCPVCRAIEVAAEPSHYGHCDRHGVVSEINGVLICSNYDAGFQHAIAAERANHLALVEAAEDLHAICDEQERRTGDGLGSVAAAICRLATALDASRETLRDE